MTGHHNIIIIKYLKNVHERDRQNEIGNMRRAH